MVWNQERVCTQCQQGLAKVLNVMKLITGSICGVREKMIDIVGAAYNEVRFTVWNIQSVILKYLKCRNVKSAKERNGTGRSF